jgi:transcriptional regulator with XRE-family HTH domain
VGRAKSGTPRRLPEKLFAVREKLGASQIEMARLVGLGMSSARVSEYERGIREPSFLVLLAYAKAARISTDTLIDDSVELAFPKNLTTPKEVIEWRNGRRIMIVPRQQHQKRLAAKLLQIRERLGVSQTEIVQRLGLQTDHTLISMYEPNKRQPPLNVLLAYARLAGVPLEQIVDDGLELNFETEHPASS